MTEAQELAVRYALALMEQRVLLSGPVNAAVVVGHMDRLRELLEERKDAAAAVKG